MRGQVAKAYAVRKIAEAFGENFIGEVDKKIYVSCPEDGEMVQIAITMTCPKVQIEKSNIMQSNSNIPASMPINTEITQEEIDNINNLMKSLNL